MKKFLALSAITLCALGFTSIAFAAEMTNESESITADYTVDASYTVTIPTKITFNATTPTVSETVGASNLLINSGETLKISMNSANGRLENGDSSWIPYSFTLDEVTTEIAAETNYDLLSVLAGNKTGDSATIKFTAGNLDNVTISGLHSDTLTFAVTIIPAPVQPYLQNIAKLKASFDSTPEQQLIDSRDGKTYWVSKLNDGNIWMTQNLNYSPDDAAWAQNGFWTASTDIYTDGYATTAGGDNAHFSKGSYYKRGAAETACPEGWSLPTPDQFRTLVSTYSLDKDNILSAPTYFTRTGHVSSANSSLSSVGAIGYYWLSLVDGSSENVVFLNSSSITISSNVANMGNSVRCIAE